ncbi:hypothetical protein L2E82_18522 [Cichorium intybus]|uniref:Uncharacterized protein n=1 Tax=Cichorium intybus TaxID=13427 RepID=A0ACB9FAC5_CICIN|nr:hypothetical protein L2E82_18522 [Cichorium intybus]
MVKQTGGGRRQSHNVADGKKAKGSTPLKTPKPFPPPPRIDFYLVPQDGSVVIKPIIIQGPSNKWPKASKNRLAESLKSPFSCSPYQGSQTKSNAIGEKSPNFLFFVFRTQLSNEELVIIIFQLFDSLYW